MEQNIPVFHMVCLYIWQYINNCYPKICSKLSISYLYFVTCYTTSIYKYSICFKCKHTIEMNVIEDVLFMGVYCSFKMNKSVVVFSLVWMTWMNVNPPFRSILAAHDLFRINCRNIVYIWEEKCISNPC